MTRFSLDSLRPTYAFLDPAGPKKRHETLRSVAARHALIVAAPDPELHRIFVLSAWAARCSTDELMDRLLETNERWRPKVIGCEENSLASLFADAMKRDARWQGLAIPLMGIPQPGNVEKDYRIRTTLQPIVSTGRLVLRADDPGMAELRTEITGFPLHFRKDMIDALASCVRMMPVKRWRAKPDAEREAYFRYLRESGATPEVIARAAAAWPSRSNPLAPGGHPPLASLPRLVP